MGRGGLKSLTKLIIGANRMKPKKVLRTHKFNKDFDERRGLS